MHVRTRHIFKIISESCNINAYALEPRVTCFARILTRKFTFFFFFFFGWCGAARRRTHDPDLSILLVRVLRLLAIGFPLLVQL